MDIYSLEGRITPHPEDISESFYSYMRSPTPDYAEDSLESAWFVDTPDDFGSSSPLAKLSESLLNSSAAEEQDIHADLPPLSSSPDLKNSSPGSPHSQKSESTSSSLTSCSRDEPSQNAPSNDFRRAGQVDDFEQRLHQLLLVALKERQDFSELHQGDSGSEATSRSITPEFNFSQEAKATNASTGHYSQSRSSKRRRSSSPDLENQSSEDISPIHFENEVITPRLSTYRIIRRAQSYCAGTAEQSTKRQKTTQRAISHVREQIYARKTASLRRKESLKSVVDDENPSPLATIHECIPTVPNSPASLALVTIPVVVKAIPHPVPLIAPPLDHVAKLPMSNEAVAKLGLRALLEREASGREEDGFLSGICERPPSWMLRERDLDEEDEVPEDSIKYDWESVMGVGRKKREAVIDWILMILPARKDEPQKAPTASPSPSPCSSPSGYTTSSTTTTTTSSNSSKPRPPMAADLYDQLKNSPETRFHAAWMFLRFFFLTMQPTGEEEANSQLSKSLQRQGFNLIVWDIAVACLSLSVKFHRDFLEPLSPVYAHEYLSLTAHGMSKDDLESAHRDILSAFDYRLGITPQPVMDLLWLSLPSLRELLDFENGWQDVIKLTWSLLFKYLAEPDVQQFPVSMLTGVCLKEALLKVLAAGKAQVDAVQGPGIQDNDSASQVLEDLEGVLCDIQALLGITDV
ncbi:hypothetical protein D9613_009504 [Agrocybe pediades]|uniref:Uncharacterized protein n=1 Tax=Agrocybe pediades TaxID=84607 RepID=A0A8H4R402_9AGAR|nr:hypothetical protein D9613_009504 [Agrocybe pediades]